MSALFELLMLVMLVMASVGDLCAKLIVVSEPMPHVDVLCTLSRSGFLFLSLTHTVQGFLAAVQQEVCRAMLAGDNAAGVSLDDLILSCKVTSFDADERVRVPPSILDGVYVNGLVLEGAVWNKAEKALGESPPKVLTTPFPVVQVMALSQKIAKSRVRLFASQCLCKSALSLLMEPCSFPAEICMGVSCLRHVFRMHFHYHVPVLRPVWHL